MWVKLTPAEMSDVIRKRHRSRIIVALFVGVLLGGLSLLGASGLFAKNQKQHPHPPHFDGSPLFPQIGRLPSAVFFGLLGAFAVYFLAERGRRTMICMKCGVAKYADGSLQCKCGGHFEDMKNLKWVEA